jgi:hypothetical protein
MPFKILGKLFEKITTSVLIFALVFGFFPFKNFASISVASAATGVPNIVAYQGRL